MWLMPAPVSTASMPSAEDFKQHKEKTGRRYLCDEDGDYDGPLPTKRTKFSRFAIIILPCKSAVDTIRKISGAKAATAYLQEYLPVDPAQLRSLIEELVYEDDVEVVCKSMVKLNDVALVKFFFVEVSNIFCTANRIDITKGVATLIRGFGWNTVKLPLVSCFLYVRDYEFLEALVQLANEFNGREEQIAILEVLFDKAKYCHPRYVESYAKIESLWKCVICCDNSSVFDGLDDFFKRLGPDNSKNIIAYLQKYSDEEGFRAREGDVFFNIVAARVQYLKAVVANQRKSAMWKIPDAQVPGEPEVEAFLRGPKQSIDFKGFSDKKSARAFMSKFTDGNCAAMFCMECCALYDCTMTVTMSKHSYKYAPGTNYGPKTVEELSNMLKKYNSMVNSEQQQQPKRTRH